MVSLMDFAKLLRKKWCQFFIISWKIEKRTLFHFIQCGHNSYKTKNRKRHYKIGKLQTQIFHVYRCQSLNKILANQFHYVYKEIYTMIKEDLFQICKAVSTIEISQSNPLYQQTTEKIHTLLSVVAETAFDKI